MLRTATPAPAYRLAGSSPACSNIMRGSGGIGRRGVLEKHYLPGGSRHQTQIFLRRLSIRCGAGIEV